MPADLVSNPIGNTRRNQGPPARQRLIGLVCIGVLCVILSLGWWPFHVPENGARWIGAQPGLRLGKDSTIFSTAALAADSQAGSIEMWVQAAEVWGGGALLSFAQPGGHSSFSIQQSQTYLLLETDAGAASGRSRRAKVYVPDVFRRKGPVFLTVTADNAATQIYVDGLPARPTRRWRVSPEAFAGRLILGDLPGQGSTWKGILRGVALYRKTLSPVEVRRQYEAWRRQGRPKLSAGERCTALYLFNEGAGRVVHSRAGSGPDLQIPPRYMVIDKKVLEPFWEEFRISGGGYWRSALKNIVGFLPVGFVFYAYLAWRTRRALAWTVVLGFLISLTIEVGQIYLPTRDSGTTDLITNTLGTYLGVLLYRAVERSGIAERHRWLAFWFGSGI